MSVKMKNLAKLLCTLTFPHTLSGPGIFIIFVCLNTFIAFWIVKSISGLAAAVFLLISFKAGNS